MLCLSSSVFSALNESTSVSKAESQFALPLKMTTFLAASVIGSPKGSAVVTDGAGAGLADAAGAGLSDGAGAGLAVAAGGAAAGFAEADGVGDGEGACASAPPIPSQIAAAAIGAAKARRGRKGRFIRISPWPS